MGFLDSIAGIMQIFAATYLPGSLLVLLVQSAIPISMFLSRVIMKEQYHGTQYAAAVIVCCGILLVLSPSLTSSGDDGDSGAATALWGGVLIASCVPMCLSSIYKEIALGDTDLDPIYLNAW
jgi:drug/metabolite transporter (DMT)-like permease